MGTLFLAVRMLTALVAFAATVPAPAQAPPRAVLVIDEADPSDGVPTTFSTTLRSQLIGHQPHVSVYAETLDLSRFAGPRQEAVLRTYIQQKYSGMRFDAIVAVGGSALERTARWRTDFWPGVPIVFGAIDEATASRVEPDSGITGVVMRRTLESMVATARLMVPQLKGVTILGGSLERDAYRRQYLPELPALAKKIEVTNLTGKPLGEQLERAARLPEGTAILYTSLFIDDAGTRYSSPDALEKIAGVANRPIVVDVASLVGTGAAGGFVTDNVAYGKEVAALVVRMLDAGPTRALPVKVSEYTRPVFDWRQLRKWNVDEDTLPRGSEFRFRLPNPWTQYGIYAAGAVSIVGLQGLLIGGLLVQRSRRRRAEVRLQESEEVHRLTLGSISDAVFITKPGGEFTFICPNVDVIFGWSHAEVERMGNIAGVLGERLFVALDDLREISNLGCTIVDKAGREHDVLVNVKRVAIGEGTDLYTCRDVTDRRRAEEASRDLAHAQRLAGMGELTAMIAHEVNQPLGAILSNAEAGEMLLEGDDPPLHEIREILESIRKNDLRADEAIRRIRGLLRRQEIELAPLDLNETVAGVLRLAADDSLRRGVRMSASLAPGLPAVLGDRVHLQQVLLNLILNAMDAMRDVAETGRELAVRTKPALRGTVEVSVSDSGPGIPEDALHRIFESFYTTKPEGTGLGLAIARTIVDTHQGRIWAENNPDGGATFRFTLRMAEPGTG